MKKLQQTQRTWPQYNTIRVYLSECVIYPVYLNGICSLDTSLCFISSISPYNIVSTCPKQYGERLLLLLVLS